MKAQTFSPLSPLFFPLIVSVGTIFVLAVVAVTSNRTVSRLVRMFPARGRHSKLPYRSSAVALPFEETSVALISSFLRGAVMGFESNKQKKGSDSFQVDGVS